MKVGVTGFGGRVGSFVCMYLRVKGFDVVGLEMRPAGSVWRNAKSFSDRVTENRNYFAD